MNQASLDELSRLHRRHTAKILDALAEINIPKIAQDAVARQFSFYTNDIKDNILNNKTGNRLDETFHARG